MSVYPTFPSNPDVGDLFPVSPNPGESQFEYVGGTLGWVSKTIALQDPEDPTAYPIWAGRLFDFLRSPGFGGTGGGG
jgi:hypothetical protein